jgi:hypothetical protein
MDVIGVLVLARVRVLVPARVLVAIRRRVVGVGVAVEGGLR